MKSKTILGADGTTKMRQITVGIHGKGGETGIKAVMLLTALIEELGMKKVYICSPYRAKDGAELDRNIDYAQQLTRQALEAGLAPITPHLYMTQCMDDKKPEERARGMAAGLALLKGCDFVIAGVKYGITEGMDREIHTANMLGITVIDANQIKRHLEYEEKRQERAASDYAKLHSCEFCKGSKLYSCTGYDCREPYRQAYDYALSRIRERQET